MGRGGNDIICGGGGNDTIRAGNGDDYVVGGSGDDSISGGPGDDELDGGSGINNISGGSGLDFCINGTLPLRGCEFPNDPPQANAGSDQTVFVTDIVTLDGSASSDPDGDPLTFSWTLIGAPPGSTAVLSDITAVMPTFVVDLPGTYTAELVVSDDFTSSAPDTVVISTLNSAPVADAGPDQTVFVTDMVTLNGGGSTDVDGDALTLTWSFVSVPVGSAATLSDPMAVIPTFVADQFGVYEVELIVNDGTVDSPADSVVITTANSPPVANAGPDQSPFVDDMVTLDGSGSTDVDGDLLTHFWSLISTPLGSAATLSDPTAVMPSFVVDLSGIYVAQLIVNDGTVNSAADTVNIATQNSPPVAAAGPDQTVFVGDMVILDGSASHDADVDPLSFSWSFTSVPADSTAVLSDPTIDMPTFFADLPGTYVVQLIVNDGTLDSEPDTVMITTDNSPPVADAGTDQTIAVGETVTLDGSASHDADFDPLTFSWSLTSIPADSTAVLSDATVEMPTFVADLPGTYVAQLIVNDGTVDSAPDTVTILTDDIQIFIADAGAQAEGNSGTTFFQFNVTVADYPLAISVDYTTANGVAQTGSDYVATSGTLTFSPGASRTQTITVEVLGDTDVEANEHFFVQLSNPVNASIGDGSGFGTILNDDS